MHGLHPKVSHNLKYILCVCVEGVGGGGRNVPLHVWYWYYGSIIHICVYSTYQCSFLLQSCTKMNRLVLVDSKLEYTKICYMLLVFKGNVHCLYYQMRGRPIDRNLGRGWQVFVHIFLTHLVLHKFIFRLWVLHDFLHYSTEFAKSIYISVSLHEYILVWEVLQQFSIAFSLAHF